MIANLFPSGLFSTSQGLQKQLVLPISPQYWNSTGQLNFHKNPDTQTNIIDWRPMHKESYLQYFPSMRNFEHYNTLSIEFEQISETPAWFFIYLHDHNNNFALSYLQLSNKGRFSMDLQFQTLFSSFAHNSSFDWSRIRSFSLLSHPEADLNIHATQLLIHSMELSLQKIQEVDFKVQVPDSSLATTLFKPGLWEELRHVSNTTEDPTFHKALAKLKQTALMVVNQNSLELEVLRDASIYYFLIEENVELKNRILHQSLSYDINYWKKLHQKNDILVQEQALYFLQIYDLFKIDIYLSPIYRQFFHKTMLFVAELQKKTCEYWIGHYPFGQGNNHVTRAACVLGIIALLYPENKNLREDYLSFSLKVLDYYFKFQISEEGVLNEGSHYYVYLMETLSYFAYYLFNTTGEELFSDFSFSKKLRKMVQWTHLIETPDGFLPCIDDSWPTQVVFPKQFLKRFFDPDAQDFFWEHRHEPWNLLKASYFPLYLTNAENILLNEKSESLPQKALFISDSQVVLRSATDDYSSYLFVGGKNMFSLHEHESAGSFQYYINDEPVITVSGYGPNGWTSKNRSYYVSGLGHNTLMINGNAPKAYYNGGIGPIDTTQLSAWSTSRAAYAHMRLIWDFRHPNARHDRHFVLLPENISQHNYLLVMDSLSLDEESDIQINLHPLGEIVYRNNSNTYFGLAGKNQSTVNRIHHPIRWNRSIVKGFHSAYWGKEHEKDYLQFNTRADRAFFPLLLQSCDNPLRDPIESSHESSGSVHTFHIDPQGAEKKISEYFQINPYRALHQSSKMGSNANFAHISYNHSDMRLEQCYIKEGSYLNFQGKGLFYVNKPLTLSMEFNVALNHYQITYETLNENTRFFLYKMDVKEIWWNDQLLPFEQLKDRISCTLPLGNHTIQLKKLTKIRRALNDE